MNVGIVGGNSSVATELCFYLRRRGHHVVPIVRNRMGTHFLSHHGFDCRVGDVSDASDAREALRDLDVVVIAAFAWQYSREGFQARAARRTNERLVRNSVEWSPADASIVYLSSQAAFGDELGAPNFSDWELYTREKRNSERVLTESCEDHGKRGYVFRLGFVYGPNQDWTTELSDALSGRDTAHVVADPDKPSNVLHTVTLANAVSVCADRQIASGVYSLVNRPQWTWREVFEYYASDDLTVEFHPPDESAGNLGTLVRRAWSVIETHEKTLRTLTLVIPERLNKRLFHEYLKQQRGNEIRSLKHRSWIEEEAFRFDPIPGPFIPDLDTTRSLLEQGDISEVFTES